MCRHLSAGTGKQNLQWGDPVDLPEKLLTLVWGYHPVFDIDTPADKQFTHSMTLQLHEVFDFDFACPATLCIMRKRTCRRVPHVTPVGRRYG